VWSSNTGVAGNFARRGLRIEAQDRDAESVERERYGEGVSPSKLTKAGLEKT